MDNFPAADVGTLGQAFCAALQDELSEYYKLWAVLEAQSMNPIPMVLEVVSSGNYLSLRRLSVWFAEPMVKMKLMAVLVDSCRVLKGGAIHHHAQHGDPLVQEFMRWLLCQFYSGVTHESCGVVLYIGEKLIKGSGHTNALESMDNSVQGNLDLFHHVETVGIFDIKWNPIGANVVPLLAQADADGYLRVNSLGCTLDKQQNGGDLLTEIAGEKVSYSMCLCLDWNPSATSISVGLLDGSVSIITVREAQLKVQKTWVAHDFEVWATSFDTHQPHLVYTGSDDCRFSCWDLRESPSSLAFQNKKTHKMGICCIAKSPADPNTLLTGSYDEYLRVWDVRSISKPINESSICLGGGVWRIKHHPSIPGLILAACMHNGFAVVSAKNDNVLLMETYEYGCQRLVMTSVLQVDTSLSNQCYVLPGASDEILGEVYGSSILNLDLPISWKLCFVSFTMAPKRALSKAAVNEENTSKNEERRTRRSVSRVRDEMEEIQEEEVSLHALLRKFNELEKQNKELMAENKAVREMNEKLTRQKF
ncbi:hypothetical protein IFM89_011620 [Coptis chinensis]|uniref:methylated diphthine methylhydrolase n=1 Tax=Coptis chinensis TaxID=261450 RepID=A0A835IXL9_9MAGN|nr:hypothetical protein IFM89_011620 [Coptis chinensis]